jgi:YD repeat-containing protein
LLAIQNRAGSVQTLSYDSSGRLTRIADPVGRVLQLSYDGAGRLAALTGPAGNVTSYGYDSIGNLTSVTYPDAAVRTYLYENPSLPSALTGIIDENGSRFATWAYDTFGRAISSEHAGGANRVAIDFTNPLSPAVTDAIGTSRTYGLSIVQGVYKPAALSQPCSACGTASSLTTYDINGNVASRTDFNGNQTQPRNPARRRPERKRSVHADYAHRHRAVA